MRTAEEWAMEITIYDLEDNINLIKKIQADARRVALKEAETLIASAAFGGGYTPECKKEFETWDKTCTHFAAMIGKLAEKHMPGTQ